AVTLPAHEHQCHSLFGIQVAVGLFHRNTLPQVLHLLLETAQFGTDDVRLVDQESFSEHLEHLMSKGIVKFEPVFVLGAYGKEMQVLVHVKGA
ncbi:hypothetical protein, partial [Pseudomonas lactis]